MIYLRKFENHAAYEAVESSLILPNVSLCLNENEVYYNPLHSYSQDYFTIESLEDSNTISWKTSNGSLTKTISVSTDNGETWTNKTSDTTGVVLATLNTGDKLLVKGSNIAYGGYISYNNHFNYFVSTSEFNVEGNIMSMIYEDNFVGQTILDSEGYNFGGLFRNCNKLISAENLILPATTLAQSCYAGMFQGCTALTTAPELPATTLAKFCYGSMFYGCIALTTAPELPATTLANNCYEYMFYGCTALTTAPELPATTLTTYCYQDMFEGCTSLNYVKCLATNISVTSPTWSWLKNVASSGTFVKAAHMTSWTTGVDGIPSDWTVQDAA